MVGNYPKIGPGTKAPSLRNAIAQFDTGKITLQQLKEIENKVTEEAIAEQAQAGIDLVTDGQIRWDDGQTYIAQGIEGFKLGGLIRYFDSNTLYRQPSAKGKLKWKGPITVNDFKFAAARSKKPVKAVLPGPYTLTKLSSNEFYPDLASMVKDLAVALNEEAKALQSAGATLIQFDEPCILKAKADLPLLKEAFATLTRGITAKTALYTYFGDIKGIYPDILKLPFNVIGLDFVGGPANFNILKTFPSDKSLAMGIIDARNTKMETVEQVAAAIDRISKVVPSERLYVNPSCGLEFLPRPTAYQKLVTMVEATKKNTGVKR